MSLTDEEARVYQQTLDTARRQIEEIDEEIERELAVVKERLAALRDKRRAALQMYGGACTMLGIENDLEEEEPSDEPTEASEVSQEE